MAGNVDFSCTPAARSATDLTALVSRKFVTSNFVVLRSPFIYRKRTS
jgi:hypothetical protein